MKLAIIRKRYNPVGGAERFISKLLMPLRQRGVDISVIADTWEGQPLAEIQWLKASASGLTRLGKEISFHRSVRKILSATSFDLIQSHERFVGADICRLGDGLHRAWLNRYQSTLPAWRRWAVAVDPFHRKILALESQMIHDSRTHFVANSALISTELKQYYGLPDSRISLIPNGVDTAHFHPAEAAQTREIRAEFGIPVDAYVVSAVGSGFHRKGFFELIQAMTRLPDVTLLIAGTDKAAGKMQGLVDQLGLSDRVRLLGSVKDVRRVYWVSDGFVLPSLYDPSSNAVLEALACGLPVATTLDVGTGQEIVQAGAGAICSRDAESIATAILECRTQRSRFGSSARTLALRFSQAQIIELWLALYKRVLEDRENQMKVTTLMSPV